MTLSPPIFEIAVLGAGPGGLGAACRAAELGASHILLERSDHIADTIYKYQRGKHVMATPNILPLCCPVPFAEGSREAVLADWQSAVDRLGVNLRTGADVVSIDGEKGAFEVRLACGDTVLARHVVLAIGMQGNLRKLRVDGAELPHVQYQLDDPDDHSDESIVVIGAGDSAIENALALSEDNDVTLLNRRGEFARAKGPNVKAIQRAAQDGDLTVLYQTSPRSIHPDQILLNTPDGPLGLPCDRVIARIGAMAPRGFLERSGVPFPSEDPNAVPEVSETYESARQGLYIIGALAGYPLIKQALNQGQEVTDAILGREVVPADQSLLEAKLAEVGLSDLRALLRWLHTEVPLFASITKLQLRELLLQSRLLRFSEDEVIFARGDYSDQFYIVVEGDVVVDIEPPVRIGAGMYFGEMALLAGRPRIATTRGGRAPLVMQVPRKAAVQLQHSSAAVRRVLDQTRMSRYLHNLIGRDLADQETFVQDLVQECELRAYDAGTPIFSEGDPGDHFHIVCRGAAVVSQTRGPEEVILSYVKPGEYLGEIALIDDVSRTATVRAAARTETIVLDRMLFQRLLEAFPEVRHEVQRTMQTRLIRTSAQDDDSQTANLVQFFINEGVAIATDVLLIDKSLCVGCDNCEDACAATHGGVSRLDRQAGPTYAMLHVPTSCRHCEHPYCMKDCPPDAIHRDETGEVFIDDTCIGCGNCQQYCPFGVIQMAPRDPVPTPSVLEQLFPVLASWLKPRKAGGCSDGSAATEGAKVAVKCDMCREVATGPACVHSCPTGAALRVSPREFISVQMGLDPGDV